MSFADQFYSQRVAHFTQAIEDAERRHEHREAEAGRLTLGLFTSLWKRTERILFAESADQMAADLLARIAPLALVRATAAYPLPATPLWLELAQPLALRFDKYTGLDTEQSRLLFGLSKRLHHCRKDFPMSETSIARTACCVHRDTTFILPSPIIECGNLSVFLDLLSPSSAVLLMPLCRRESLGDIEMTLAVQVTAQITDAGGPAILTATFLAAACTILGATGSLLIPCEERGKPAAYAQQRARDLQNELLECLMACLAEHPSVDVVRHPARYGVPHEWVWRLARLDGGGITFIKGHWSRPVLPVAAADPYGHALA